jgi:hypothetical protein
VAIEDPILLINIEESSTHSMVEVEAREPRLTRDPPIEAVSSLATTTSKREGLACLPTPSPPSTKTTTRRRKSCDRSSLRRSARLAQRNVLKDLGIIGGDEKFNEEAIQEYADHLRDLLPLELLKPLMSLRGRAFWDLLAGISLPLR